jgi:Ni,Fe-hydrogenase III large subunit
MHTGVEGLMAGAELGRATKLAARTSGDSTVAYAFAFARAAEAALGIKVPPRATWLRALMAELERLANHFGDLGMICKDALPSLLHDRCGVSRELVLRACDAAFGHRLGRDRIVPGGVVVDPSEDGLLVLEALAVQLRTRFPEMVRLYADNSALQDRTTGTARLPAKYVHQYAAGGFVGRASGRDFDARRDLAYAPYDELTFIVPLRHCGDVNARVWVRILEIEQSLSLVDQILARLPVGPISGGGRGPNRPCEGMAIVEGFRGDILAWIRFAGDGTVERCHLRDPSWFQWPLLELAMEGNTLGDFLLCCRSFNCSSSGHDL